MWIPLLALTLVLFAVWIFSPLFGGRRSWATVDHATVEEQLLKERERLLRALKDLEQEREAGSIGEEEYEDLRREYLVETAAIYRRMDSLGIARTQETS